MQYWKATTGFTFNCTHHSSVPPPSASLIRQQLQQLQLSFVADPDGAYVKRLRIPKALRGNCKDAALRALRDSRAGCFFGSVRRVKLEDSILGYLSLRLFLAFLRVCRGIAFDFLGPCLVSNQSHTDVHRRVEFWATIGWAIDSHTLEACVSFQRESSIFTGELKDFLPGVRTIDGCSRPDRWLIIYTDSKGSVEALQTLFSPYPLACVIHDGLAQIGTVCTEVTFCWVPRHVWVADNERPNAVARAVFR